MSSSRETRKRRRSCPRSVRVLARASWGWCEPARPSSARASRTPNERITPLTPRRRPAAGGVGSAGTVRACLSAGTPAPGGVEIDDIALAVLPALGSGVRIGGGGDRPPAGLALEFRPQDGLGRCGVEDVAGFRQPGPARTRARLLGHAPWTARQ